jgi:RNA polymerase sigma factor (sigma-70 family)
MIREEQETLTLIQNVINKDRVAEEKFYNKYKKIIEDYIKYKLPKINNDDFDDCVSNILIKLFYNLDKYDPEKSSFKSWVITITKHYLTDMWRCGTITIRTPNNSIMFTNNNSENFTINNAQNSSLPEWTNSVVIITSNSMSLNSNCAFSINNACNFENCNSVNYISNQLSSVDFTLLNMKYVQGYEYCDIGKEFNMSSNTASNKVNYIKTKLKKNIAEDIYD